MDCPVAMEYTPVDEPIVKKAGDVAHAPMIVGPDATAQFVAWR